MLETTTLLSGMTTLVILTGLEIVLGIDNLIFIAIITHQLEPKKQKIARQIGLLLAWTTRLLLLAGVVWMSHLTKPLFLIGSYALSVRDLLLLGGGLFLLVKATQAIHDEIEDREAKKPKRFSSSLSYVVTQIAIIDIIFSLDSVITAVGLTQNFWIMAIAISIAILVMIMSSGPLIEFIKHRPAIRMLAFCFLMLIGMVLVADGLHYHIERGYIYFAIAFSVFVETLNMWSGKKRQ